MALESCLTCCYETEPHKAVHVQRQSGGLSQSKLVNLEVDGKDWNM